MRRLRVLPATAGLTALLFVVGACGQAADQGAAAGQPQTPTGDPTTVVEPTPPSEPAGIPPEQTSPPEGAVLLPKDHQVDTSALPSYYTQREVWSVGDGRTLAVSATAPTPCTPLVARVAEQTDQLVRIAIAPMDTPQGEPPDGPGMCAQVITPKVLTVTLAAPLGARKVIVTESP